MKLRAAPAFYLFISGQGVGRLVSDSPNIIIKKVKKVSGGGHHGGAWKVAYADFVTAMMAFFLLMWLLNATTEDQRKGIADYFNPSIPVSTISGGGTDVLNGSSVFSTDNLAKDGTGGDGKGKGDAKMQAGPEEEGADYPKADEEDTLEAAGELEAAGDKLLEGVGAKTMEALENDLLNKIAGEGQTGLASHLQLKVTPEGIVIDLVDVDGRALFEAGSTSPSPTMRLLLKVVASTLSLIENEISIVGHTDGYAFSSARDYSNWELSTDRAQIARRLMSRGGLRADQINEVAGKANTEPLVEDPFAPQNRRISITILKD